MLSVRRAVSYISVIRGWNGKMIRRSAENRVADVELTKFTVDATGKIYGGTKPSIYWNTAFDSGDRWRTLKADAGEKGVLRFPKDISPNTSGEGA